MITFETPRIVLRHLEPQDLAALFALYRDPEIRQFFPDGIRNLEETRQELEWFRHSATREWSIAQRRRQQDAAEAACTLLYS